MVQFPKSFLWGAATSAHQVEGDNVNSDWYPWEQKTGKEHSARACRHYELYEPDFDLARGLHHNAHRLSVEWARLEPRRGEFSQEQLQHYIDVILALRKRGLEPMVTLHHFTNPAWFSDLGGWEHKESTELFMRYCDLVVRALAPHVRYWVTINEPTIYSSHAYLFGVWPPQVKSILRTKRVQDSHVRAHIKAYALIHDIYRRQGLSRPLVGIAQHIQAMAPCADNFRNRLAVRLRDKLFNFWILDDLFRHKTMDFIGVNYYSRQKIDVTSWWIGNLLMEGCSKDHDPVKKNSLGWDIYPQGLLQVLLKLKKYDLPVMITENGICTADDALRWEFIREHLKCVHQAMDAGVDVQGYLYWSLMDNFEWHNGFGPRFGLVDIDYNTYQRTVRDSARKFGEVCRTGVLN